MKIQLFLFNSMICSLLLFSCNGNKQPSGENPDTDKISGGIASSSLCDQPVTQRVVMALRDQLGGEVEDLVEENRKFSYEAYDLDGDGREEYFVALVSPYFCGSGGCTAFIFNNDLTLHSDFTVMDFPVYISKRYITGGWPDLYAYSGKAYHLLKFDGQRYPANPSVAPVMDLDNYPDRVPLLLEYRTQRCIF